MSPTAIDVDDTPRTGALLLVLSSVLWGCWSIALRGASALSSTPLSPVRQSAVVLGAMLLVLVPCAWSHRPRRHDSAGILGDKAHSGGVFELDVGRFVVLGISDALNMVCFFAALAHTSVAVVVLCRSAAPVLVALVAPSLLNERRHPRTLLALVVAAVGLLLVLQPWTASSSSASSSVIGALCGLGSACWYACSVVVGKQLAPRHEATALAAWPLLVSVPVVVLAAMVTGEGPLLSRVVVEGAPLLVLVVGGVVCGAVALLTFYAGLRRLTASRAGVLTLVEPVVAVVVGAVVFHEALSLPTVIGGLVVIAAVAAVNEKRPAEPGAPSAVAHASINDDDDAA